MNRLKLVQTIDNVSTRKYNNAMTKAIVTKTGNSYALRVPKRYIVDNNLKLGDVVDIEEPLAKQQQALDALINHGRKHGSIKGISDLVDWQRKQRDWKDRRADK